MEITFDKKEFEKYKALVERATKAVFNAEKKEHARIQIHLVKDRNMQKINKAHRKKDKPTNVLSFVEPEEVPHPELKKGEEFLGEIYLAPEYIKEKEEDIQLLLIHGLLHLLGYTHEGRHDRIEMEKKEKEILQSLISKP